MKKLYGICAAVFFAAMMTNSAALAGDSTACGTGVRPVSCNKSSGTCTTHSASAPCNYVTGNYKRDVLGKRVPVQTEKNGTWHNDAAGTQCYIITGCSPQENS